VNIAWYARIIVLMMEISRFIIETRHVLFPPNNKNGLTARTLRGDIDFKTTS